MRRPLDCPDEDVKHYVYRLDHDTGFAPHVEGGWCLLCGCKTTTVERWAEQGSWVIGIGGNRTRKPDRLLYAMQVNDVKPVGLLRRRRPRIVAYLRGRGIDPSAPVLLSRNFYYFGDKALPLPSALKDLVIRGPGCKRVSDRSCSQLVAYLSSRFRKGSHGEPNNVDHLPGRACSCGRCSKQ